MRIPKAYATDRRGAASRTRLAMEYFANRTGNSPRNTFLPQLARVTAKVGKSKSRYWFMRYRQRKMSDSFRASECKEITSSLNFCSSN